jgi:hypothetical protein
MANGDRGFLLASPWNETVILSRQIAVFAVSGSVGRFNQSRS